MSSMKRKIQSACLIMEMHAMQMVEQGTVPNKMGPNGIVALIYSKCLDYYQKEDFDILQDIGGLAAHLVASLIPDVFDDTYTYGEAGMAKSVNATDLKSVDENLTGSTPVSGTNNTTNTTDCTNNILED